MAKDVTIAFEAYANAVVELAITDADVTSIANQFPSAPLTFDTGTMLGTIPIMDNQRETARDLMNRLKNNPAKPQVRLRYMCRGGCEDLPGVEITLITETVDRNRANFQAFGMGIELAFTPVISPGLSRVVEEGCAAGQKRMIQDFIIEWNLDRNVTPGVGGMVLIREETQRVLGPCCAVEDPGH